MPLVKASEIYRRAREGRYGIGGFCAENLDMILAILMAAEEAAAPVVLVFWEADIDSVGAGYLEAIARHGAEQCRVPVAFMLDHGSSLASCLRGIVNGHTAVMIDASHESYERNIQLTRQVCEIAHTVGVLVESELGTVRRSFEMVGPYAQEMVYTDPDQVSDFVGKTGIDALAISIGTESGIPSQPPVLDYDRLNRIASATDAYLVVHGGSGTAADAVRKTVEGGVTAYRFASEMRIAYLEAIETARQQLPKDYPDTRRIFEPARQVVKNMIVERLHHLGCVGKAW